jgi:hypothetical protein
MMMQHKSNESGKLYRKFCIAQTSCHHIGMAGGAADRPLFTSTFQRQSKFYSLPVRARDKNLQRNNKTPLNGNLTLLVA